MATGQALRLNSLLTRLFNVAKLRPFKGGSSVSTQPKSTFIDASADQNCKVEIGVTSDGKTIVCYHPTVDFPYELSQPIPRSDPLTQPAETHDQVLKAHLSKDVLQNKQGPTMEELSKMFHTTKHRWYPVGQYHTRRKKKDPPKDR